MKDSKTEIEVIKDRQVREWYEWKYTKLSKSVF